MEGLGDLLLDAEIHLQRQLLPQLADSRLPALRHQNEYREKDRLERDDHGPQSEGKGVELGKPEERRIPEQPRGEHQDMEDEEPGRARQGSKPVSHYLHPRLFTRMLGLDGAINAMGPVTPARSPPVDPRWQRRAAGSLYELVRHRRFGLVFFG